MSNGYTAGMLQTILDLHLKWLHSEPSGLRANLRETNLREANLNGATLRKADLRRADLRGADLYEADLSGADLRRADLRGANLSRADLNRADLYGAELDYPIYQAYLGRYHIHTNKEYIRIGCTLLTIEEWMQIDEDTSVLLGLDRKYYSDYMDFVKWYSRKPISKGII